MTETVLPISPEVFWGIVNTSLFFAACLAVGGLLNSVKPDSAAPLVRLKRTLGLRKVNSGLFLIAMLMWSVVAFLLVSGLIWTVWDIIWQALPAHESEFWDWRFALVKLTALTATLGAVVAFPITMQRLRLTQLQTSTASEALFNDKINAAANDLHAQRQVTINVEDTKNRADIWQDDIVKRNAAIDRLELLVHERPDTAPRVARMLCTYVRELSKEYEPKLMPKDESLEKLREWVRWLKPCRSDLETAVQTLGRLKAITGVDAKMVTIDLRGANLQKFNLAGAILDDAQLNDAHLQGAHLYSAQMQRAIFWGANLQGATFSKSNLSGSDFTFAMLRETKFEAAILQAAEFHFSSMQSTDLTDSDLRGAQFAFTDIKPETSFDGAQFFGAAFDSTSFAKTSLSQSQVDDAFFDGSVIFSPDISRPLEREKAWGSLFNTKWREWQKSIGFDPDTYQA